MPSKETHHHIRFASRYAKSRLKTFRAFSALWRCESLIDDIQSLQTLRAECQSRGVHFGHILDSYEVMNFYGVGFVTCLEWHARSRLVDLMIFKSDCIEAKDVKDLGNAVVSQMMSENVSVPYLVGAATGVSSILAYTKIFERIFEALGISDKPEKVLRDTFVAEDMFGTESKSSMFDVLDRLFEERHELVHEIGPEIVAHRSLRHVWWPEWAMQRGVLALDCMKKMESILSAKAPPRFPNRLDGDFIPENETLKVVEQIKELEDKLSAYCEMLYGDSPEQWRKALAASRTAVETEIAFISGAEGMLRPVRHLDFRPAMEHEYLKLRLEYLKELYREAVDNFDPTISDES